MRVTNEVHEPRGLSLTMPFIAARARARTFVGERNRRRERERSTGQSAGAYFISNFSVNATGITRERGSASARAHEQIHHVAEQPSRIGTAEAQQRHSAYLVVWQFSG